MATNSNAAFWFDRIREINPDAVVYEGYETCIVGICERFGMSPVAAYDYEKCIEVLMRRDKMPHEEAIEFFECNTLGAWAGENTPVFVHINVNKFT